MSMRSSFGDDRMEKKPATMSLPLDISKGGDPVGWLANIYPYKLPQPFNDTIHLVKFQLPRNSTAF